MINYAAYYDPNARYPLYSATHAQLLELLNARRSATLKRLQRYALEEVVRRHHGPSLSSHPLTQQSVLSVQGSVGFRNRTLRAKLEAVGVAFAGDRLKANTTHVLLCVKVGETVNWGALANKTLLLEQDLQRFLDRATQPYLQQAPNPDWVTYLNDLLLSEREEEVSIALGLFEVAGFVPETLLAVILAIKLAQTTALKKALTPYVERYANSSMYHFFTLQYQLNTQSERRLASSIHRYVQNFPTQLQTFGLELARLLYLHRHTAFLYIWRYSRKPAELLQILEDLREGNVLNLSDKDLTLLPKNLGVLKGIQKLDLRNNPQLKRLPKSIQDLRELQHLDLTHTGIRDLQPLRKLPQLHTLHLTMPNLPINILMQIPQLKKLYLPKKTPMLRSERSMSQIRGEAIQQTLRKVTVVFY